MKWPTNCRFFVHKPVALCLPQTIRACPLGTGHGVRSPRVVGHGAASRCWNRSRARLLAMLLQGEEQGAHTPNCFHHVPRQQHAIHVWHTGQGTEPTACAPLPSPLMAGAFSHLYILRQPRHWDWCAWQSLFVVRVRATCMIASTVVTFSYSRRCITIIQTLRHDSC